MDRVLVGASWGERRAGVVMWMVCVVLHVRVRMALACVRLRVEVLVGMVHPAVAAAAATTGCA